MRDWRAGTLVSSDARVNERGKELTKSCRLRLDLYERGGGRRWDQGLGDREGEAVAYVQGQLCLSSS